MVFGLCRLDIQSIVKEPYVILGRRRVPFFSVTYYNDEIKIIQLSNAAGKKKMQNHGKAI